MEQETQKSEWNVDDEVLKAVCSLKFKFLMHMEDWELEKAYWTLLLLNMEIINALKDETRENEINEGINRLEGKRSFLKSKNDEGKFYAALSNVYKLMNSAMIDSGWYFRRKEMYMGL